MAGPEDKRKIEDQMRERATADRDRAEQAKLIRAERVRHDAIGLAQHILDPRVVRAEVIQPEMVGLMMVAAVNLETLSPYESGPIRDALLIKAMGGDVEKIQAKLVEARTRTMEGMMVNPVLVSALEKYNKGYDPDIGDRPVEMTSEEWEAFGRYEEVRGERQALVDVMTNGVASLYDDRDELDRRSIRLSARLDNLLARRGTLTAEEKEQYSGLLAVMFGALRGPEAINYSRWAGMAREELTVEEQVMLDDIWRKMMEALGAGEQGELEELERGRVRGLTKDEERLLEKRKQQLLDVVVDTDEKEQLKLLLDRSSYGQSDEEKEAIEARLELVAEEAGINSAELKTFERLKERRDAAGRLEELKKKEGSLSKGERGIFEELRGRAGSLTEAEERSIKTIETLIPELEERKRDVEKQIQEKTEKLEVSEEWMNLAKAFAGIVSNINVTDQWRRAWHDYGAGAQDSFTQTRWAEYQRVSELIALMEMPGVGRAMQKAFRAMCLIGLNRGGEVSPRALNIMQMKGVTEDQIQNGFILPIREYVKGQIGNGAEDLYVNFGVEMARMLLENSLAAGWLGVERDDSGNIKYKRGKDQSSNVNSEEYKYAEAASAGDGSAYGDRQNDYIKLVATRAKQMAEFAKGYETGLPALVPVLPDWLTEPWIAHKNVVAIANGNRSLLEVFTGTTVEDDEAVADYPENSRWGWAYGMFRGAQIYDLVSKFIVGLKGFRGVAEEVDFFLRSPANLGSLSKKIDVAFGDDLEENQRFRMNVAMSLIYAVYPQKANPLNKDELKTVLHDRSGGKELTIMNFEKDDIARIFVHRSGFLSEKQWDYLWSVRLRHQINPGEGGGFEVGMIKRGENLPEYYLDDKTIKENRRNRREAVARAV